MIIPSSLCGTSFAVLWFAVKTHYKTQMYIYGQREEVLPWVKEIRQQGFFRMYQDPIHETEIAEYCGPNAVRSISCFVFQTFGLLAFRTEVAVWFMWPGCQGISVRWNHV